MHWWMLIRAASKIVATDGKERTIVGVTTNTSRHNIARTPYAA